MRRIVLGGLAAPIVAAAVVACGSSGSVTRTGRTATRSAAAPAKPAAAGHGAQAVAKTTTMGTSARAAATGTSARSQAESDARALLAKVVLPPGSQRLTSVGRMGPKTSRRHAGPKHLAGGHMLAKVPEPPATAIKWFEAHVPHSWTVAGQGYKSLHGVVQAWSARFEVPAKGLLRPRWVAFHVTRASIGTLVDVNARVAWVSPRPGWSHLPMSAKALSMKVAPGQGEGSRRPGRAIGSAVTITRPSQVRLVTGMVNRLHPSTDLPIDCPAVPSPTLYLWIAWPGGGGGTPLAVARVDLTACGEGPDVTLTAGGRQAPAMTGSSGLIAKIERGLHIQIGLNGISAAGGG